MAESALDVFCAEMARLEQVARQYQAVFNRYAETPELLTALHSAGNELQKLREVARHHTLAALSVVNPREGNEAHRELQRLNGIYAERFSLLDRRRAAEARRRAAHASPVQHSSQDDGNQEYCVCASLLSAGPTKTCAHCSKPMHTACLLRFYKEMNNISCPFCRA